MKLVAHDQRDDAITRRYSIQRDGKVWLLFDLPENSPFKPYDIATALLGSLRSPVMFHCSVCHQDVSDHHSCGGTITPCGPRCGPVREQNERLRAALKEIADYSGYSVIELTSKARRALQSE